MKLKDKVALVTGAGSGIGRATAVLFAREGARVAVADIQAQGGQETVQKIRDGGGEALFLRTDVSKARDVENMIRHTIATYGRIDILHNNAATVVVKLLEDLSEEEWDRVMAVNVKSIFLAVKYVIPHMKKNGGGSIINTASTQSFVGEYGIPAYVASKGAILLLTKTLALDYVRHNIRVNCVCPSAVDTAMLRAHCEGTGDPEAQLRAEMAAMPIGRLLAPEEIAHAALYLASDQARGVTGSALVVDGGYLAGAGAPHSEVAERSGQTINE